MGWRSGCFVWCIPPFRIDYYREKSVLYLFWLGLCLRGELIFLWSMFWEYEEQRRRVTTLGSSIELNDWVARSESERL